MLGRVVADIRADKPRALDAFTHGRDGFRTQDIYVLCVGPDGVMSAHPNPELAGHDALHLRDAAGKAFIQDMLAGAREGQVAEIHYFFPKLGTTLPEPKTTYYTRIGDQVCGVGYYDADAAPALTGAPAVQIAELRRQLDRDIPANLRPEWTALLQALDAREAALAKAREDMRAAQAALVEIGASLGSDQ